MKSRKVFSLFAIAISLALFSGIFTFVAEAGSLKAKVYLTQSHIPKKLTEKGLIRFASRNRTKHLRETSEDRLKERSWKANMVISFNHSPGDLEFQVLFYDIHDGPRRFIEDMSTFVNDKNQKTYLQKLKLSRERFKPNRNMELVVTVRRQEVGRLKFGVVGQEIRRSGEVSFTDEEAQL